MIEANPKIGVIEKILKENFQRSPRSQDFNKFVSQQHLRLVMLDRINKNLAYVTDGVHTIFTILATKQEAFSYNPFTRYKNGNYTYEANSYAWLAFKEVTEPPSQSHPYNPHHYLKDYYKEFVFHRKTYKINAPAKRMVVLEWNLALVNISSEGYYAPVIAVRKSKLEEESKPPNYLGLNCVLFEKWLQHQMEWYRINDIRKQKCEDFPALQRVGMFYFMRSIRKSTNFEKKNPMGAMDYDQLIIKHNPQLPLSYIIVGKFTGAITFPNAIRCEINEKKIQEMNIKNLLSLFNGFSLNDYEMKKHSEKRITLWSSDSDSSDDDRDRNKKPLEDVQMEEEESESDEGEDPLKNLYLKELQDKGTKAE